MWYVIQTITGKEQILIELLRKIPDSRSIDKCFYIRRESIRRLGGECIICEELMFPGYIFVQTQNPEKLYEMLRQIPRLTRILGKEECEFYPLPKEEEKFLKCLLNKDKENIVRLSPVKVDEQGELLECSGVLKYFEPCIVRKRIRLRYVFIRITLLGRERDIKLGICLDGDREGGGSIGRV